MLELHIGSIAAQYRWPELQRALLLLATKAAAMGILKGKPIRELSPATVGRVLSALQANGLLRTERPVLEQLLEHRLSEPPSPEVLTALTNTLEVLEHSPTPAREWHVMREVLGDELVAELLGISVSSVKRYARGERVADDDTSDKLHYLAMVVADLYGSYNELGIRRWFERPRAQLGGRSPRQVLGAEWSSTTAGAQRVRQLAHSLVAGGST